MKKSDARRLMAERALNIVSVIDKNAFYAGENQYDQATFCKGTGSETDKICKNCWYLCFDDDPINGYTRFCGANKRKTLTRPPQSWCYVEELR